MRLNDYRIGTRLTFGFGVLLVLMTIIVVIGGLNMKAMHQNLSQVVTVNNELVKNAQITSKAALAIGSGVRTIAFMDDAAAQKGGQKEIDAARVAYRDAMVIVEKLDTTERGKQLIAQVKQSIAAAKAPNDTAISLGLAGRNKEALSVIQNEAQPRMTQLQADFDKLLAYQEERSELEFEQARKSYRNALLFLVVIGSISLVGGIAMAWLLTRSITRPLAEGISVANQLARGILDIEAKQTSSDETGQLLAAMYEMIEKLRNTVRDVLETSVSVASASTQLFSTAEKMAAGTEEVASQAGSVATAVEEMATTSGEIANNCGMAADNSKKASDSAENGAQVVKRTILGMERIALRVKQSAETVSTLGSRSTEIGAIIGTIEDIADQTNLLALNAAIEAARAGEQGRGFAVVADEVRALAERTTKATREISSMIKMIQQETAEAVGVMEEGVREVGQGTDEATRSGEALQEILQEISEVSIQVSQIATAAEQQTATSSEVSNSIQHITSIIGDTARGAHETAAATKQLNEHAAQLQSLMSYFRIAS